MLRSSLLTVMCPDCPLIAGFGTAIATGRSPAPKLRVPRQEHAKMRLIMCGVQQVVLAGPRTSGRRASAASPCRLAAACECSQSALSAARPAARRLAMRVPHVIRRDAAGFAAARPFRRRAKSSLVPFALIACESMRAVRSPHKVVVRLCLRYSCNVM